MPHWKTILTSAGRYSGYLASIVVNSRIYILSQEDIDTENSEENRSTILKLRLLDRAGNSYRLLDESQTPVHDRAVKIQWCIAALFECEIHFLLRYCILRADDRLRDELVTYNTLTRTWSQTATTGSAPSIYSCGKGCQVGQAIFFFFHNDGGAYVEETVYTLDLRSKQWSFRIVRYLDFYYYSDEFQVCHWNNYFVVFINENFLTEKREVFIFDTTNMDREWFELSDSYYSGISQPLRSVLQTATYDNKLIVISDPIEDHHTPAISYYDFEQGTAYTVACNDSLLTSGIFAMRCLLHNHLIYCFSPESRMSDNMTIHVLNMRSMPLAERCVAQIGNNERELRSLPSVDNIGAVRDSDNRE